MSKIHELTAEQLLGAYRSRELSPVELTRAHLDRSQCSDPTPDPPAKQNRRASGPDDEKQHRPLRHRP